MILMSLALAASLQGTGETALAIRNDNPETWVVEYPLVIRPFVVEYRQCLNIADRRVTGEPDFEAQHSADIPRCDKLRAEAIAQSNAAMEGAKTRLGAEEVEQLFRNIGLIHVARGRDLDAQFNQVIAATETASESYEAGKPKGLVLELRDASVVKSRTDTTAPAAAEDDTER